MSQLVLTAVMLVTILGQALWPQIRLLIVLAGAGLSMTLCAVWELSSPRQLFSQVPWDVLVILVALGMFAQQLAATRVFGLASLAITRWAGARPLLLLVSFTLGTYLVSGVVNNLTALLMILPVLLSVFALVGVSQRFARWTLGLILVACNLGGAATPIGDFPAVLLLGRGTLEFSQYLKAAAPPTALALGLLLLVALLVFRPDRDLQSSATGRRLTLAILGQLYRGVRLDRGLLLPCLAALALMLAGWTLAPARWGLTPELVCWLGAGLALLARPRAAETMLRQRVDVEAGLFLLGFFLMVGAVRSTGLFSQVAQWLTQLPLDPRLQVMVFLVLSATLTGLFSAGPSMAALLEVADGLARQHPAQPIYIGLALSVCAGSSLFLTAATSGPLTQALVERAQLRGQNGQPVRFTFGGFVPIGLLAFAVILGVNLIWTYRALSLTPH